MKKTLKLIGGEAALPDSEYDFCFTDSGRSSLRLILRSLPAGLKYLLPDFLCSSVIAVFDELKIEYSFYKIKNDFSIDASSIGDKNFDVFYNISYFGRSGKIPGCISRDKMLIDDNVFLPDFEMNKSFRSWAGFNSFRKISPVADGSLAKASFKLKKDFIAKGDAPFAGSRYLAKKMKYEFFAEGKYSEREYLDVFEKSEYDLDLQRKIYGISERSRLELLKFFRNIQAEESARTRNFDLLAELLKGFGKPVKTAFCSFYPLLVDDRDLLRKYLFGKKIFLPVHWPGGGLPANMLYDRIISIPVDSRYSPADMKRVALSISDFYMKH